jgi:hypothetical protein
MFDRIQTLLSRRSLFALAGFLVAVFVVSAVVSAQAGGGASSDNQALASPTPQKTGTASKTQTVTTLLNGTAVPGSTLTAGATGAAGNTTGDPSDPAGADDPPASPGANPAPTRTPAPGQAAPTSTQVTAAQATSTVAAAATSTSGVPTATPVPGATFTPVPTNTVVGATNTPPPNATNTPVIPTNTPPPAATNTPQPTNTPEVEYHPSVSISPSTVHVGDNVSLSITLSGFPPESPVNVCSLGYCYNVDTDPNGYYFNSSDPVDFSNAPVGNYTVTATYQSYHPSATLHVVE